MEYHSLEDAHSPVIMLTTGTRYKKKPQTMMSKFKAPFKNRIYYDPTILLTLQENESIFWGTHEQKFLGLSWRQQLLPHLFSVSSQERNHLATSISTNILQTVKF